jgi:hypothetical protein
MNLRRLIKFISNPLELAILFNILLSPEVPDQSSLDIQFDSLF